MSRLIRETEELLVIEEYLHSNTDSYADWMLGPDNKPLYSDEILEACGYALYEVKIRYVVYKKTRESTIVAINDRYVVTPTI